MSIRPNSIQLGDCVELLNQVEAGSVDLAFADPPFNIGYDYDVYDDDRSHGDYLQWSATWMQAVNRVLKPAGSFWLAIGDEYAAELKLTAQHQAGFHCRSWVIWYYTFGVNCVRGFSRSHTHLFHFVKDPKQFTFNAANPAVRVPSARQLVYADLRANGKGRLPDNTWILRPHDAPVTAFDPAHDTWYYARVAGTFKEREGFHGCQMPEQLLGRIIRVSSNPTELVLDPFAGSGTTLAVAKKLGRQWLGIELSADYVQQITVRVDACRSGDPLEGPADPRTSAPRTSQGKSRVRLRGGRPSPPLDQHTQLGIIDAFQATSEGNSTDFVLCHPKLNARFVDACRERSLAGDAFNWNRLLLRIRKAGRLPKSTGPRRTLSFAEMDLYSAAAEIGMQLVTSNSGFTIDEVLCSPDLAAEFDELAARFAAGFQPWQYRWAAMTLRKRAKKSRELAAHHLGEWRNKRLPRAKPVEACLTSAYETSGVYVVLGEEAHPLYVGETINIRSRIEQIRAHQAWTDLAVQSVKVVRGMPHEVQYGLQSLLIERTDPLLNLALLCPKQQPLLDGCLTVTDS